LDDQSRFRPGERVPLEIYLCNMGQQTVVAQFTAEFYSNVPTVRVGFATASCRDWTDPIVLLEASSEVRYE
jgi:hypothetical protein